MSLAPLWKPSRLESLERKAARKTERLKAKQADSKRNREEMAALRDACFKRDSSMCRACKRLVHRTSDSELERGHMHHVIYRSAGGPDTLENVALLCAWCHDAEHRHILHITGDPNGVLSFKKLNPETGQVLSMWVSR